MTAREKIEAAASSAVYPIEGKKAARYSADTMLVPSPKDVREAIAAIPYGETKSIDRLRMELAEGANAGCTCPRATTIGWFLVAEEAEDARRDGASEVVAWWRVTRDGKPDDRLPGGKERQLALLAEES